MSIRLMCALSLALTLLAGPGDSLERAAVPMPSGDSATQNDWCHGDGVTFLEYYNTCTGWVWLWSGFDPGEKIGSVIQRVGYPDLFRLRSWDAAPAGYGYTVTVSVHGVDADQCPAEPPYAMYSYLPTGDWFEGWISAPHHIDEFVIVVTTGPGEDGSFRWPTDHPAAGPTGPQAMGTCYPADRPTRSFRYGTAASPLCPGVPFNDGVGDALLLVEGCWIIDYGGGVAVEGESWGRIKGMYR